MTATEKDEKFLWQKYESTLEEYTLTHDLDDMVDSFKNILSSTTPKPSIKLLSTIATRFVKIKHFDEAKLAFGLILQEDNQHKETWKALSSLYFEMKENKNAEFCLQKYYSLKGGGVTLSPSVKSRLKSAGKLP